MSAVIEKELKITKIRVLKLIDVIGKGLCSGVGVPTPGEMCVQAAICYAFDLDHGDRPSCVGRAVREFDIGLNDTQWSSKEARAKGMLREAIAKLGSDKLDQAEFARRLALGIIREVLPVALDAIGQKDHAKACRESADLESGEKNARSAAAYAAAYAAANANAYAAAYNAAYAAANAANAAYAAANAAYADTRRDEVLSIAASVAERILIDMGSEGSKYLYLLDE